LFKNLNFLGANGMMFALGVMLFSSLVMMPLFLQSLMGYTAESAGLVLSGGGLLLLLMMPIVGVLSTKVQSRYLVAAGWGILAFSMYYSTKQLDLLISFQSASWLRVVQVAGLGFLFVPINMTSYIGMPPEKSNSIAGTINFMRNIGSSVGTSMVTTLIARRSQVHQNYLVANVTRGGQQFLGGSQVLSNHIVVGGADAVRAAQKSLGVLYQSLIVQATTLAYIDTFLVLAGIAAIMFVLSFGLRKNQPGARPVALE
ncbi:MAG TPA: MFS transporter, partial [Candidatus Acidoferrales bacterium]